MPKGRPLRIVITTGDVDGIGTEVATKSLARYRPSRGVRFYLWRSPSCPKGDLRRLDRNFKRVTVGTWSEALRVDVENYKTLIDINSTLPPACWVETSATAGLHGHVDALVTGPLSKTSVRDAGMNDMGHTGILQRATESADVFPAFIGDKFNVVLVTGHISIDQVTVDLETRTVRKAILAADGLRQLFGSKWQKRPVAVVGLNPHAGEAGLIGDFDDQVIRPVVSELSSKMNLEGPLVPDAAFLKANWDKYSVYVSCYHDQGLIPFKMVHGHDRGIQVTLGLPIIRTSVDHGTAKDLFGKGQAEYRSMLKAIDWGVKLAETKLQ